MIYLFFSATKNDFLSLLIDSAMKFIFHWKSQLFQSQVPWSLLRSFPDVKVSCTTKEDENKEALVVRPFIRIINVNQKQKGPRMEPWGTPGLIFSLVETCPLRTTRGFLFFKKCCQRLSKFPDIPFWVSLQTFEFF